MEKPTTYFALFNQASRLAKDADDALEDIKGRKSDNKEIANFEIDELFATLTKALLACDDFEVMTVGKRVSLNIEKVRTLIASVTHEMDILGFE